MARRRWAGQSTGGFLMSNGTASPSNLITPYNTEEFWQLVDMDTKFLRASSIQTEAIAIDLRKLLAEPEGTKMAWARADLRLNAMRVARHWAHAAKLKDSAGKSERMAWLTYLKLYTESPKTSGRTFQVN